MIKQFHVYYLFHYYFYVTHTTKSFTCYTGKQVRACFECIYNKLLIRKFDEDAINQKLSSSLHVKNTFVTHHIIRKFEIVQKTDSRF